MYSRNQIVTLTPPSQHLMVHFSDCENKALPHHDCGTVLRKRIQLVVQLFKEAGAAVHAMPLLALWPLVVSSSQQ